MCIVQFVVILVPVVLCTVILYKHFITVESVAALFWSTNRIDYVLEPPSAVEGLNVVPLSASPHVIHSRYWEAKEFLSFVLRQVITTS